MGYLNALLEKIQAFNVPNVVENIIVETEESLVEIQRAQMMHGLNADGKKIGEYKQESYANYKYAKSQLAGFPFVDLRNTGSFQNKITAVIVGDELIIDSYDDKTEELVAKYGEEIFGINKEFKKQYLDEDLRPAWKKQLTDNFNLPLT